MRTKALATIMSGIGLAGLLLAPGPAWGQGQTWAGAGLQQMLEAARWRIGAFRVNTALRLASAGYDSDIYHGYLDERVPDITASASLPVQVLLPLTKKAVIEVSDRPEYVFYLDTRDQRTWNNTFSGRFHIALDRFYVQAGGGLSNIRRRLSPELDLNVRQKTNSLSGLVLWQASRTTSLALLYGGAQYSYEDIFIDGTSLADRLNRNEEFLDLISYIQPSAKVRLSLDAQYGSYQFRRTGADLRDANSYAVFAGIEFIPSGGEFELLRGLRGSAALGYTRIDMRDPGLENGSGLVGEGSVSARLSRRITGDLFYSRGFRFSIYAGASYYLATRAGAGLTFHLARRADVSYSFSYGRTSYTESDPDGGGTVGRYYRYLTHALSLNLRLGRQLSASVMGSFGQRDRGGFEPIRERFFAGVSLVYGFAGGGMSAPARGGIR